MFAFFQPSGQGARSERILLTVVFLCIVGWVGGSLYVIGEAVWWGIGTRQAEGEVLSVTSSGGKINRLFSKVEVEFVPSEGAPTRFIGQGFRSGAAVGDAVEVRFHPDEPAKARIDGLWDRWGGASVLRLLLLTLGIVTCYSLLHSVVVAWRKDGLKGRIEA